MKVLQLPVERDDEIIFFMIWSSRFYCYRIFTCNIYTQELDFCYLCLLPGCQAVEQLNIKPKSYKDLLTDEPFTRQDIVTLQVSFSLWCTLYHRGFFILQLKCCCVHSSSRNREISLYFLCYPDGPQRFLVTQCG